MCGRISLIFLMLLGVIGPASGQDVPPPTRESVIALGSDIPGRMTVPVTIGGDGPYPFTIDTGAERSVISNELASLLKLIRGKPVRVTTITGSGNVATALIPSLRVSNVQVERVEAPTFRGNDLGAPGLLGLDLMAGHAVRIDFETNEMRLVGASARPRGFGNTPDEIVIRARNQFRQLVVTNAYFRGKRIRVILDTGTAVSLGNLAMRRLVGDGRGPVSTITLTSVTGAKLEAEFAVVKDVTIGGVVFQSLPVAFRDAAPFASFGLSNRPALLLGMDALRQFRRVDIDFANREVRVSLPRRPR
jgi:predicted aspartyl protease